MNNHQCLHLYTMLEQGKFPSIIVHCIQYWTIIQWTMPSPVYIHNAFTCILYNFYTLILELSCTYTIFKGWTLKKQQHSKKNCMQMWRRKKTFFTLYVKDILFRFPPSLVSTALLYFNNTVLNRTALPPIKINCLRLHPPGI